MKDLIRFDSSNHPNCTEVENRTDTWTDTQPLADAATASRAIPSFRMLRST